MKFPLDFSSIRRALISVVAIYAIALALSYVLLWNEQDKWNSDEVQWEMATLVSSEINDSEALQPIVATSGSRPETSGFDSAPQTHSLSLSTVLSVWYETSTGDQDMQIETMRHLEWVDSILYASNNDMQ